MGKRGKERKRRRRHREIERVRVFMREREREREREKAREREKERERSQIIWQVISWLAGRLPVRLGAQKLDEIFRIHLVIFEDDVSVILSVPDSVILSRVAQAQASTVNRIAKIICRFNFSRLLAFELDDIPQ